VTLGPYLAADDSVLKRVHLYVLASDNVQTAELYHMNQMYAKQFFYQRFAGPISRNEDGGAWVRRGG
jgi:hypothetical protein